MKVPPKVHMTRLARSLVTLQSGNYRRPKAIPMCSKKPSFPYCPVCVPKQVSKTKKKSCKVDRFPKKKVVGPATDRAPNRLQTVPENEELTFTVQDDNSGDITPNAPPSMDAVREVVQTRLLIRRMLTKFGEATVTEFIERMNSPLPTVDMIFTEELHNYWIMKGDFHRLPVDNVGNLLAAVPAPEWGIVNVNEVDETIWTSPYASMLRQLAFVDLTSE